MEKRSILIIEDDRIVALDIQNQMQSLGYSVLGIASSAEEALMRIEKTEPDLILMDVKLRGRSDGIEAAEEIRDRFDIPVIFLTAFADAETVGRAKLTEPFGYIVKPFHERELHANIEMALYNSKLERELRDKEEYLKAIVTSTTDGVVACDSSGRITFMNPVAETLTGWRQDRALGKALSQVITIIHKRPGRAKQKLAVKLLDDTPQSELNHDLILVSRSAKERYIEASTAPIRDKKGNRTGSVVVIRDITAQKRSERSLSARLQTVREEERAQISRELHDELGQILTAIKMELRSLSGKAGEEGEQHTGETGSIVKLIDEGIITVRRISTELRPRSLDEGDISAAVKLEAEEFQKRTGIQCDVTVSPENMKLDKDRSTAVFRIVQETLTNVARHAEASKVTVELEVRNDRLVVRAADNGRGIHADQISSPKSLGLIGMRERLYPWEGVLDIRGQKGRGTTVTASLPIDGNTH